MLPASQRRRALGALLLVLTTALVIDQVAAAWVVRCKSPLVDALVSLINPIGSGVTLLIVCLALALLSRRLRKSRMREAAWLGALSFAAAGLTEFILKHLVGRPRPDTTLIAASLFGPSFEPDIDSFPSGHATSVFAVATAFAVYYPRLRWPLYGLATAIALGRVYLARHSI